MRNIKEVWIKKILIMYYLRWERSPRVIELMNSERRGADIYQHILTATV